MNSMKSKKRSSKEAGMGENKNKVKKNRSALSKNKQMEVVSFLIENYGAKYYNSPASERVSVINEILEGLKGKTDDVFTANDIVIRLKSLKSAYFSQKSKEKSGEQVKWKFFETMKQILKKKPQKLNKSPPEDSQSSSKDSSDAPQTSSANASSATADIMHIEVEPAVHFPYLNEDSDEENQAVNLSSFMAVPIKQENNSTSIFNAQQLSTVLPSPAHLFQTSHSTNPFFYANNSTQSRYQPPLDFSSSAEAERNIEEVQNLAGNWWKTSSWIFYNAFFLELRGILNDLVGLQNRRQEMDLVFSALLTRAIHISIHMG